MLINTIIGEDYVRRWGGVRYSLPERQKRYGAACLCRLRASGERSVQYYMYILFSELIFVTLRRI